MDVPALERSSKTVKLHLVDGIRPAIISARLSAASVSKGQIGAPLRHYQVSRIPVRAPFLQLRNKSTSEKKLSRMGPFFIPLEPDNAVR
jgi:hypothetical protein